MIMFLACGQQDEKQKPVITSKEGKREMSVNKENFGKLDDGTVVDLYTIKNSQGMVLKVMNYGATVVSLAAPDRNGEVADITLGHDTIFGYINSSPYFGSIVGRYGNRIAQGKFTLEGIEYSLATNDGDNHLHGGIRGFDKVIWEARPFTEREKAGVTLSYLSKDGEEGYPGNLKCSVVYSLTESNELTIEYQAVTDQATPVNLTHHSYFNLAGQGNGDVLSHELMLKAEKYTPVDQGLIPTGEIRSVHNTPMDFLKPTAIGARIEEVEGGYDHNFVLSKEEDEFIFAAQAHDPASGRIMEVFTTEPGIQFYSGNFLDGSILGKAGKVYKKHYGFCLETQHFPDSPNQPEFPSTILSPGEQYTSKTVYKFKTDNSAT
ncbi:MAG: galactose mutarotase [Candidatus Aminicenantes bacterium]|nr:galactose mutarotase [Candidatus Aminicenantes bacterium]